MVLVCRTSRREMRTMPQRIWMHTCRDGRTVGRGSPGRCSCGAEEAYDGWHNTQYEAMAWYQKRYGVKPIGPHRPLTDRLFSDATRECSECAGHGYHNIGQGKSYRVCTSCGGAGRILVISDEDRSARRSAILAEFPDAAAPFDIPSPAAGVVIQDLQKGVMIVSTIEEPK
jgi:hypothetical protein